MKLIDQYVYAVTKHLPENTVAEVEKELRSNIADMLPDSNDEKAVRKVLLELGSPEKLAEEYQDHKRYLIGPANYSNYIFVLKTVFRIVGWILPIAAFISALTDTPNATATQILTKTIVLLLTMMVGAAINIFSWVTIAFAIAERTGTAGKERKRTVKAWSPDDMEEIPDSKKNTIPRREPIGNLIFIILFLAVFQFSPHLFGWYSLTEKAGVAKWNINPLFDVEVLSRYVPFAILLSLFMTVLVILKLKYRQWNHTLAGINALYNAVSIIFVCVFFSNHTLFNEEFLLTVSNAVKVPFARFQQMWYHNMLGIIVLLSVCFVWNALNGFLKARRTKIH